MQEFIIKIFADSLARVTIGFPLTLAMLWFWRWTGIIEQVGWPTPTTPQLVVIAMAISVFGR